MKKQRNSFVALCEIASQNNWCWNINCTTCGHNAFKVSFSKLIQGVHPDHTSFWPNGKENNSSLKEMNDYSNFLRNTSEENQIKLVSIVVEAKLTDIQVVTKFPDWLGYIGLVMNHCPSKSAYKILSESFLPQFIVLIEDDEVICKYLKEKQSKNEILNISDLSKIEKSTAFKY